MIDRKYIVLFISVLFVLALNLEENRSEQSHEDHTMHTCQARLGLAPVLTRRWWGYIDREKHTPQNDPQGIRASTDNRKDSDFPSVANRANINNDQEAIHHLMSRSDGQTAWSSLKYAEDIRFPESRMLVLFFLSLIFMISLGWIRKRSSGQQVVSETRAFPEV
ncbi:MAG: hypothetical protein ACOC4C_03085 [Fibrobacterota bacterium]